MEAVKEMKFDLGDEDDAQTSNPHIA